MVYSKLWLMGNFRAIDLIHYKKIDTDLIRQFFSLHLVKLKKSLFTSNWFLEDGEIDVGHVQSKVANFYKEILDCIKKHKKLSKNLHYFKEVENTGLINVFEAYMHLNHEKSRNAFEIKLKEFKPNKHYEMIDQIDLFNFDMFIMIYIYLLIGAFLMFIYMAFLNVLFN
ncbi:unnamed protein product [Brachionus calyciflorus]|uniref:Uncharacterized protein n=1 Tax=Brachionus calyciflorus TaxID=104777 RepID=A0A814CXN1_9BILA|nr:unnamed protein product [Brachionus calyciflorus]